MTGLLFISQCCQLLFEFCFQKALTAQPQHPVFMASGSTLLVFFIIPFSPLFFPPFFPPFSPPFFFPQLFPPFSPPFSLLSPFCSPFALPYFSLQCWLASARGRLPISIFRRTLRRNLSFEPCYFDPCLSIYPRIAMYSKCDLQTMSPAKHSQSL